MTPVRAQPAEPVYDAASAHRVLRLQKVMSSPARLPRAAIWSRAAPAADRVQKVISHLGCLPRAASWPEAEAWRHVVAHSVQNKQQKVITFGGARWIHTGDVLPVSSGPHLAMRQSLAAFGSSQSSEGDIQSRH